MTPKQTLLVHIEALHRRQPPRRLTLDALSHWHATEHHRYTPRNHYHAGTNLGPNQRPPGWRTGEDAVVT